MQELVIFFYDKTECATFLCKDVSWLQSEWIGICWNKAEWFLQETVFSLTLKIFLYKDKLNILKRILYY